MKHDNPIPGLGIRFQPADFVYVYENHGAGGVGRDLYTAVLQNIAFVNESETKITLDSAVLDASREGAVIQSQRIGKDELVNTARQFHAYQKQGLLETYDFQFQTRRYLKNIKFTSDTTLMPGHAIVVTRQTMLFQGLPDTIKVTSKGHTPHGDVVSSENKLKVVNHKSKNEYIFPVRGRWLVAGAPSLHSHHRWGILEEFALDLAKMGQGGLSHSDNGTKLAQFYAYGEPIYAIGDGLVVSTRGDMEESDTNLQQPEESAEVYFERMLEYQQALLAKGFSFALGNHIVIQHAHDEYSRYVHLQHSSVRVQIGDRVSHGQQIANLGHSGNSTEPHLHFDVADSPDLAYSRSIPLTFTNITLWPDDDGTVRHLHLGQVVVAGEC
ncbi:MAG: M23 family metallopeptidase [Anaerolineales bacterium]|nr:M23 family metallopeptidase [Chloroflexota bacterium]MBL6982034.1 M23 family metallopeptidase [Anaerolineales bacterium]